MKLRGADGSELRLSIQGYEFPQIKHNHHDSNWLVITIGSKTPRGSWEATTSALMTSEAAELARWFHEVAVGGDFERVQEFLEHCLRFEYVDKGRNFIHLRIGFGQEFTPPWASGNQVDAEENAVDYMVSAADLKQASKSLRAELRRFPTRA